MREGKKALAAAKDLAARCVRPAHLDADAHVSPMLLPCMQLRREFGRACIGQEGDDNKAQAAKKLAEAKPSMEHLLRLERVSMHNQSGVAHHSAVRRLATL